MSAPSVDLRARVEHDGEYLGYVCPAGKRRKKWVAHHPCDPRDPVLEDLPTYRSREEAIAWLMSIEGIKPKRPWHATTLRECGQFIGAALLVVGIVQVWVMIGLSVLAIVLGGLLYGWMLVDLVV